MAGDIGTRRGSAGGRGRLAGPASGGPAVPGRPSGGPSRPVRRSGPDGAYLMADGYPTQLGLGEAGLATGLAAIRDEVGRAVGHLTTWLAVLASDPALAGP